MESSTRSAGQRRRAAKPRPPVSVIDTPENCPRTVDDLFFTARTADGRLLWWNPNIVVTNYWNANLAIGRACAFEVLDLFNGGEGYHEHVLSFIVSAMVRNGVDEGVISGFLEVFGEVLFRGDVNR